ncbi:hypothetical protein METBIDRAFT_40638 [Metschnikowia bicuspidata var. bicuspidata NRRL YB-4993]|uniref:37S ribosomal protein YMR-31, mitochondrial n=1 Tax=Metschnikowia bicuspidata var. bicuspidata NRRL YB-4993 TaxID=869754 RepID=A0A1A0HDU8_9ASCO|nr:hypothetical protein METBIDRAFT_40638 [Metschnikowia bicuspidata var. bicuspidata NRRL YB-4993]OBA22155.1 hypothetical protein METBIDRAFT_40638 [Metschnikowia bicuspidata var. bicuspidata NRRL YB-4993]
MRQSASLLKHVPLIKFVGGPHQAATVAAKAHPFSPSGKMPTLQKTQSSQPAWKPIELQEGEVLLRNQLSKRFRYMVPSTEESEQIESGGAGLVY